MSSVHLSKLHATGNDFLVWSRLGARAGGPEPTRAEVVALCDRRRGVGADGVLVLGPGTDGADVAMVLRNADGDVAEMSGNGIRCLAEVAVRAGCGDGARLVVDTAGGRRTVELDLDARGELVAATVDMGPVSFDPSAVPVDAPSVFDLCAELDGVEYRGDAAGMGNPHLVLFVDDPATAPVPEHGPRLERDPRFPNRTNVEFVAVTAPSELSMRVWERGVGETLSCGTGACAAAAVAHRRGLVNDQVVVHVPGGDLTVSLGATVHLGGPVVRVFETDVDLDRLAPRP